MINDAVESRFLYYSDRQTDGFAVAYTALAKLVLRRAVKAATIVVIDDVTHLHA